MESSARPSGTATKKDKGKKLRKNPRGIKDKDQMKYQFQGEPLHSKVSTDWKEIVKTNIGHIDIDEFKKRVKINPTTKNARLIRQSRITKVVGFPPSLIAPELVRACQQAYELDTRTIIDKDGNILADMSAKGITRTFHIPTFQEMEMPTIEEC